MIATKDNPLIVDLSDPFGYRVQYWPWGAEKGVKVEASEEPLGVDFRLYRTHEKVIWECEFTIKWDGCVNLSSNPLVAMHFCSHEGVRTFAAVILKCFELAATLMPTRDEEFLNDSHYDDERVMALLNKAAP